MKPIDKHRITAFMLWEVYHQYYETYGEFKNICLFDFNADVMNDLITNDTSKYRVGEENIEDAIFVLLEAIDDKESHAIVD